MKLATSTKDLRYCSLLAISLFAILMLTVSEVRSQSRDLGLQRIIMDDGEGGKLTISYPGPGNGEFFFSPGSSMTVPPGTINGQTITWSGNAWIPTDPLSFLPLSTVFEDAANIFTNINTFTLPTILDSVAGRVYTGETFEGESFEGETFEGDSIVGQTIVAKTIEAETIIAEIIEADTIEAETFEGQTFTGDTFEGDHIGDGDGLTNINATNISTGELDLDRINSDDADEGEVLTFTGGALTYAPGGAFTLPYQATTSFNGTLFSITNTNSFSGGAGYFAIQSEGNDDAALTGESTSGGAAIRGIGDSGPGGHFTSQTGDALVASSGSDFGVNASSDADHAGFFHIDENLNGSSALYARTAGGGAALYGEAASGAGVYGISSTGAAGQFEIYEDLSTWPTVFALHKGLSEAGEFMIDNPANDSFAVEAVSNGTGGAIFAQSENGTAAMLSGSVALNMLAGGLVVSQATVGDGAISLMAVSVNLNDAVGGSVTEATLPGSAPDGQVVLVTTNDPDGATLDGSAVTSSGAELWIRVAGQWKRIE